MGDTQWLDVDDGKNPNTCAVDIINEVNQQFINSGVKFVVHVGDLADNASSVCAPFAPRRRAAHQRRRFGSEAEHANCPVSTLIWPTEGFGGPFGFRANAFATR